MINLKNIDQRETLLSFGKLNNRYKYVLIGLSLLFLNYFNFLIYYLSLFKNNNSVNDYIFFDELEKNIAKNDLKEVGNKVSFINTVYRKITTTEVPDDWRIRVIDKNKYYDLYFYLVNRIFRGKEEALAYLDLKIINVYREQNVLPALAHEYGHMYAPDNDSEAMAVFFSFCFSIAAAEFTSDGSILKDIFKSFYCDALLLSENHDDRKFFYQLTYSDFSLEKFLKNIKKYKKLNYSIPGQFVLDLIVSGLNFQECLMLVSKNDDMSKIYKFIQERKQAHKKSLFAGNIYFAEMIEAIYNFSCSLLGDKYRNNIEPIIEMIGRNYLINYVNKQIYPDFLVNEFWDNVISLSDAQIINLYKREIPLFFEEYPLTGENKIEYLVSALKEQRAFVWQEITDIDQKKEIIKKRYHYFFDFYLKNQYSIIMKKIFKKDKFKIYH